MGRNVRAFSVDRAGRAHLLFHPSPDPAVLATRSAAGGWTTTTVEVPAPWIGFGGHWAPAVALDDGGGLHVAIKYAELDGGYLFRPPGGGWAIAEALPMLAGWFPRSIGVDAAGGVHVAYMRDSGVEGDPTRFSLEVARRSPGGAWSIEIVATDADGFVGVGIVVRSPGDAHLAWTDRAGTLHHAWRAAGSWTTEVVGAPGLTRSGRVALALDAAGAVHLAYAPDDRAAPRVGYLRRDPASGAWSAHDLALDPLAADVGPHSAGLAADRDGGVHVAYGRLLEPLAYAHRRFCL